MTVLAIILGILAGVFFVLSAILLFYVCQRRLRKRKARKHGVGELYFKVRSANGRSLAKATFFSREERDGSLINGFANQGPTPKDCTHAVPENSIVPYRDLQTIPELPYDPNYDEIMFDPASKEAVSLSSLSGSESSAHEQTKQREKSEIPENDTLTKTQLLLDPDTGIVPLAD